MPRRHTSLLLRLEGLKVLILLLVVGFLTYCYLSFDLYTIAAKTALVYYFLTSLGYPPAESFVVAVHHAYGGIVGDIGALLRGMPTTRDLTMPYLIAKFMELFENVVTVLP